MNHSALSFVFVLAAAAMAQEVEIGKPATPTGQIACNRGGKILLLDAATGAETVLVAKNTYDRPLYWLPAGDRLIYWNHDGGAWDLWAIDPETQKAQNLTNTARDNRSPCASPDGQTIAFHRGGDGVWLMDADGRNQRRIHELGHRDIPPVWSPSGRWLAFSDMEPVGEDRIRMVVYAVPLVDGVPGEGSKLGNGETAFFLDETQLVLTGRHEGRPELVVVDVTSGERRALTDSEARDDRAVLSPDRRQIAWIEDGGETDRLKIMNVDGTGVRDLTAVEHFFAWPSFSPDGRFLAFESGKERRKTEVYIVATAGGPATALTIAGGNFPIWRPSRPGK